MEIMKVLGRMVCTQRVDGLGHMNLRILENKEISDKEKDFSMDIDKFYLED